MTTAENRSADRPPVPAAGWGSGAAGTPAAEVPTRNTKFRASEVAAALAVVQGKTHWEVIRKHPPKWNTPRILAWIRSGCPFAK